MSLPMRQIARVVVRDIPMQGIPQGHPAANKVTEAEMITILCNVSVCCLVRNFQLLGKFPMV